MDCDVRKLLETLSELNDRMGAAAIDDKAQIARFCDCVVAQLQQYGLVCHGYDAYLDEWRIYNASSVHNVSDKSLSELCTYLLIYQRQEHMSGDCGGVYADAFKSGAVSALIREILRKIEKMVLSAKDTSDKSGRIGIAGEYFVAAELTRRGYVTSLTSKNTKTMDLLASDKGGYRQVALQVKTCDNPKQNKWKMSDSVEKTDATNLFFVFVNMNGGNEPSYYVVPSKYVAYRVRQDYENWLNTPGKNGHVRQETTMRTFEFLDETECDQYRDAWHLLGL